MSAQQGRNLQDVKTYNRFLVFDLIRCNGLISRTDIAKVSGLNKATVGNMVTDLLDAGLVREVGNAPADRSGGRKATLLSVRPEGARILAVDLSSYEVTLGLVDCAGKLLVKNSSALPSDHKRITIEIVTAAKRLLAEQGLTRKDILGVSVSVPGLVDGRQGRVEFSANLGWTNIPLARILETELGEPVYVEHTTWLAALAESRFGGARGASDAVYVMLGNGIGGSLILGGQLYTGCGMNAGEIGHMIVEPNGMKCTCGNRGCLETLVSFPKIVTLALKAIEEGVQTTLKRTDLVELGVQAGAQQVLMAAETGDPLACSIMAQIAGHLGLALANLVNILNPKVILIGSMIPQGTALLARLVEREVKRLALSGPGRQVSVIPAELGCDAPLLGGATLVLEHYLDRPPLSIAEGTVG